jgi:hypothetical protein
METNFSIIWANRQKVRLNFRCFRNVVWSSDVEIQFSRLNFWWPKTWWPNHAFSYSYLENGIIKSHNKLMSVVLPKIRNSKPQIFISERHKCTCKTNMLFWNGEYIKKKNTRKTSCYYLYSHSFFLSLALDEMQK